jgi:hypothetical protein
MINQWKHYGENYEDIVNKKLAIHRLWQPRLFYRKDENKHPNKKKKIWL